jgi:hypothetical protein
MQEGLCVNLLTTHSLQKDRHDQHQPAVRAQHLSRPQKITFGILATLVAIVVIAIIILLTFDWNRPKPWLNAKVSEAIERPFAIRGNLAVHWETPASSMPRPSAPGATTFPGRTCIANDVHVGNPAGMPQGDMASVRQFSFSLNPFGLLATRIHIPVLRFDGPRVDCCAPTPPTTTGPTRKRTRNRSGSSTSSAWC